MITLQASRLTEEQLEIITSTEPCLTVTAYAGTGKTTTIRALAQARPHERMLYLAFNRSLATETRAAFGDLKNVEVKTLHGLAWHECGRNYRKIADIRPFELSSFINSRLSDSFEDSFGLARIVLDGLNDWLNSAYREIELFLKNYARRLGLRTKELNAGSRDGKIDVKTVQNLIKETWSACQNRRLAMPHNGYLKLFQLSQKKCLLPFDRILVDEAQDLNDCMIDVVLTSRAKKVFVGDPYQQIYAFNGAVNALTKAASQGAASYFLTQSFRCPDDIAKKANQYLKLLGAPKPFRGLNEPKTKEKTSGQLIIARTNAGLFDFVAKQLPKKFFFYIGGFEGYEFDTILDVVRLLTNTPNDVKDIFLRNFSCFSQLESYAERAKDTVLTSRIRIAKRYKKRSFSLFRDMWVNQVFKESEADYIATTAHKIKGQEHQQVCLLDDFVSLKDIVDKAEEQKTLASLGGPRVLADDPYLSLEEFRLLYVSITRSFNSLNMPARYQLSDEAIDQFKELCSSGFIGLKEGPNFLDPNSNPQTLVSPSDS